MPHVRFARCLLCLALIGAPACQSFYSYRPMTIQARDAETGQPLSSTSVHISYPLVHASQAPYESGDATGPDGLVHLQAAPFGPAGVLVEAKAHGYLMEQLTLPVENVEGVPRAGWFEDVNKRPAIVTIEMYAEPRPTAELVVPVSFRGILNVEVKTDPKALRTRGQRCFTYPVGNDGKVELTGPPLLARVAATDYCARYADGTKLSRDAKGLEIGFWGLNADGNRLTFLVGTRDEFEAKRREALANDATARGRPTSSSGSGGRRGGHGRRGGGQTDAQSTGGQ